MSSSTWIKAAWGDLTPGGIVNRFGLFAAPEFFAGYLLLALLFFAVAVYAKQR